MIFSGDKCAGFFKSNCPGVLTVSPSVRVERLELHAACTTCGRSGSCDVGKEETLASYHAAQEQHDANKDKAKIKQPEPK